MLRPAASDDHTAVDLATRRRAEILYGSIRVIARDGVSSAKLKDIARESGVSLGLVQHYFGTKEELVNATFEVMMRASSLANDLDVSDDQPPLVALLSQLRLHVYGIIAFDERWHFWIELWAAAHRSPTVGELTVDIYALWAAPFRRTLGRLAEEGLLADSVDLDGTTTAIMAILDGMSVRAVVDPETLPPDLMYTLLIQSVTRALGIRTEQTEQAIEQMALLPSDPRATQLSPGFIAEVLLATEGTGTRAP